MKSFSLFAVFIFLLCLSSCAKCNYCSTDNSVEEICTNSVLDRAKAKSACEKEGGEWLKAKI